ncbi:transposase, partial [Streptococcus henryi]
NYFKELIKEELHSEEGSRIYAKRKIDVEPVFGRLKSVFGVRRVHVRGNQAVQTEVGFLFMSMNLTKLAKNLGSKTSHTQKPHSDSFILIVFETEITVWFYFEASFCPASIQISPRSPPFHRR